MTPPNLALATDISAVPAVEKPQLQLVGKPELVPADGLIQMKAAVVGCIDMAISALERDPKGAREQLRIDLQELHTTMSAAIFSPPAQTENCSADVYFISGASEMVSDLLDKTADVCVMALQKTKADLEDISEKDLI